jgi:hypothetical protein
MFFTPRHCKKNKTNNMIQWHEMTTMLQAPVVVRTTDRGGPWNVRIVNINRALSVFELCEATLTGYPELGLYLSGT